MMSIVNLDENDVIPITKYHIKYCKKKKKKSDVSIN